MQFSFNHYLDFKDSLNVRYSDLCYILSVLMNLVVILLQLVLLVFVGCENNPPPDITDPGQLLYLGYTKKDVNCGRCHGPEGQGGMQAPDIRGIFNKYDEDKIIEIIQLGKGQGSNSMPPFEDKINREELIALMNYLKKSFSTNPN